MNDRSREHPASRRAEHGGLLVKLLALLAVAGVIAVAVWVIFLPAIVTNVVRSKTGFEIELKRLSLNPFSANAEIEGMVVRNPPDWPAREFVELRELRANARFWPLLKGRFEADELIVDVASLTLVRNRSGTLNAVALKDGFAGPASGEAEKKSGPAGPAAKKDEPAFNIARMTLKFDRLVFIDHSGWRPVEKTYNLNIRSEMRDVDTVAELMSPFSGAALHVVTETLTGLLKDSPELLKTTTDALKEAGKKTGEAFKGLLDSLDKLKPNN